GLRVGARIAVAALRLRAGPGNAVAGTREAVAALRARYARALLARELLVLGLLPRRLLAVGGAGRRVRRGLARLARVHRLGRLPGRSGLSGLSGVLGLLPRLGRRGGALGVGLLVVLAPALLVRSGRLREAVTALRGHRPLARCLPLSLIGRAGRGLGPGGRIAVVGPLRSRGSLRTGLLITALRAGRVGRRGLRPLALIRQRGRTGLAGDHTRSALTGPRIAVSALRPQALLGPRRR
ncbi:hypothetical protein GTZ89_38400, partial [Streptomyces sp. SID8382]|uniref:hypothetical protein n=1 Tax=Streptomyces malaysiensis TaxID=92644 RepID=UPI00136D9FF4